jgi:hypothetical protein
VAVDGESDVGAVVVVEVEHDAASFGMTIERYVFAMLAPVAAGVAGAEVSVESSEERTNGTRLRVMPAPKTR